MRVGFSGTRQGMSRKQKSRVQELLEQLKPEWFHHGDCIGADEEAAGIASKLGIKLESHPPENTRYRAFCPYDVIHEPKPYIERNHDIVDAVEFMIFTPATDQEVLRSGTWAIWRYAQRVKRTSILLIR